MSSGNILVGSSGSVPTSVAVTGDVTISNAGLTTIANDAVTFGKMQNVSGYSIVGKPTTGSGDIAEIGSSSFMLEASTGFLRQADAAAARSTLGLGTLATQSSVSEAAGGTGQTSYTIGDILYASGTTALSKLAGVATGNALISGGVGVAPTYGKVGLTTHVSGTLPAANGGTGYASYVVGDITYADSTTTLAKLADVATGNALLSGGVGVAPTYGKVGLTTHVSGTLPAANGGTGYASYAVGDILYASTSTALSKLADVATGNALLSGGVGVAPTYGKVGLTTHVSGTLPVANGGTNQVSVARGQISKMTSFTAVTVSSTGTYYPLTNGGTLDTTVSTNMTLGATSTFSIMNTSGVTRVFRIYASVDATASANDILGIMLYAGVAGSLTARVETECRAFTDTVNDPAKLVTSWMISLANNEEVAVYVANHTEAANITAQRARIVAEAVL
jgi:hypothetical protein